MVETGFYLLEHYALLLLITLVLFGAGRQCLRKLEFRSILEEISFSTGLGLGLFGTLVFFLGLAGLIYLQTIILLLLVMGMASAQTWRDVWLRLRRLFRDRKALPGPKAVLPAILVGALALVVLSPMLIKPFYPPHQWDAISYHLAVAKSYASSHTVAPLPHLRFCVFPQLMNMLFASMLLLQDEVAAQLMSFLALVITALSVLGWGARVFSFRAGVLGAAILLGSPMILLLGSSAYIDMGLTMFVTLAILAMFNWVESKHGGWVVLAGAMIGFAAGVKYTGAFLALAFLILVLANVRTNAWRLAGGFLVAFLLTAGPWYARNVIYTNDPFFPMLGRTVPNPCWDAADAELQAHDLVRHGGEKSIVTFLRLPWDLTFNQKQFVQDLGTPASPVIFVLLPLTIWFAWVDPLGRRLVLVIFAFTLFWFLFAPLIRYIQPIVPVWSLATAAAVDRLLLRLRFPRAATVLIGLAVCAFFLWHGRSRELPQYNPVPVTDVERDVYLNRFPTFLCYDWLNRHAGRDYRVYSLGDEYMAYFADGIRFGDHMGPGRYRDLDLNSAQGLYRSLRRLKIDYLMTAEPARLERVRSDPQFSRYFQLVCANAYALAWQLTPSAQEASRGGNLFMNPGLESVPDKVPGFWGVVGSPRIDVSGTKSRAGAVSFRADRQNYLFANAELVGDQLYEIRFWARADGERAEVRFEFHWQDEQGNSLGAATQLFEVGTEWTELVLPLMTPENTAKAVFYPHASDNPVWLDDFSIRPILQGKDSRGTQDSTRAPRVSSITKRARDDGAEVVTVTAEDPDGAADIFWIEMILGDEFSSKQTCALRWSDGALSLIGDDGTLTGRLKPGSQSTIENSFCRVDGSGFETRTNGSQLVIEFPLLTEKSGAVARAYARAQDRNGLTFFWEPLAEWAEAPRE